MCLHLHATPQLMASAVRTMALALGRGALTLGSAHPLPTEPLVIPPLCLSGVVPGQHYAHVPLDLSTAQPAPGVEAWICLMHKGCGLRPGHAQQLNEAKTGLQAAPGTTCRPSYTTLSHAYLSGGGAAADITAWAEFHNGAAAGLRMAAEAARLPASDSRNGSENAGCGKSTMLTRNWIVFHRPDSPSYTHAGLLMSLGLAGHLRKLSWTDLYRWAVRRWSQVWHAGEKHSLLSDKDGLCAPTLRSELMCVSSFPQID